MGALILFIAYQVYRYAISPSAMLMLLTVFDLAMLYLTCREYKRMKAARAAVWPLEKFTYAVNICYNQSKIL